LEEKLVLKEILKEILKEMLKKNTIIYGNEKFSFWLMSNQVPNAWVDAFVALNQF
jgi:hypothetical protein